MSDTGRAAETIRDLLIDGLRNAHAMESQAIELTTRQAERLQNYPELQARIQRHVTESEEQRRRLDQCLAQLGTSESTLKDVSLQVGAAALSMVHAAMADEVLKNSFGSYAFEHFEIASYTALAEIAEAAGEPAIAAIARQNMAEEQQMAEWLQEHLPGVVRTYIRLAAAGEQAKR